MLDAHASDPDFLEQPAGPLGATVDVPAAPRLPGENLPGPGGAQPGVVLAGRYKLLEQIGEGGFGVVFMAEQTQPVRRKVALKVLKPGMDTRQVVARFEAERQALALMDHPNIARVLDAGQTSSGRPYFVMDLVKGLPITEFCDQQQLTPRQRVELLVHVCRAVQHAHHKGIIHRDLKPSNVLVSRHDTTPVVKIIDFGVAKALGQELTDKTLFTGIAQMVGTPLYMSPEQAGMSDLDIDTRSDIYSLGVLLYELLTGTTPFDKEHFKKAGYDEIRRIIREEEPPKPSTRISTLGQAATTLSTQRQSDPKRLSQLFRGELDWIVMKALEKERSRRYETAAAFARDIERYLADEAVAACPPSTWYRFRKVARRHKTGLLAAALIVLALVAGTAVSLWQAIRATEAAEALAEQQQATQQELGRAQQAEAKALAEVSRAQAAEAKASRQLFESLVAGARAKSLSRHPGQRFQTLDILRQAVALARQLKLPPERYLEMRNVAIAALALPDLRVAQEWTDTPTGNMVFAPGLKYYAHAARNGTVSIRRAGDGAELCRLPGLVPGERRLRFSPDGRLLAVMHPGRVQVWKLAGNETGEAFKNSDVLPGKKPAKILDEAGKWDWSSSLDSFSPDSGQFAVQHPDLSIGIFDLATAKRVQHLALIGGAAKPVFNPKGRQLALFSQGAAQVHDLQTCEVVWRQAVSGSDPWFAWHPDGKTLAVTETIGSGTVISLWDVATGKQVGKLEGTTNAGVNCVFNHAGTVLASVGWEGIIRLWDPLTSRQLFSTHAQAHFMRFSPDDRFLAATEEDNKLRIWEIAAGNEYRTLTGNPVNGKRPYFCSAVSADGHWLAAGGGGGVDFWELPSGKNVAFLEASPGLNFVLREPSGALLTMGQKGLFRWPIQREAATGSLDVGAPEKLPVPGVQNMIAQSADGRVLASAQFNGAVVLHADQPDRLVPLGPHVDARYVAVSPNGQWVATGGFHPPGGAKVWAAGSGKLEKTLPVGVGCWVVFSPDGKRLLTSAAATGKAHQIRVWQVGSWAEILLKEPIQGIVPAFSPDGKLLVVETGTGVARLLDPNTGTEYARLEDPSQDRTFAFSFSPDSTKLVCATVDGCCVHVWDLPALRRQLAEMDLDWESPP